MLLFLQKTSKITSVVLEAFNYIGQQKNTFLSSLKNKSITYIDLAFLDLNMESKLHQ